MIFNRQFYYSAFHFFLIVTYLNMTLYYNIAHNCFLVFFFFNIVTSEYDVGKCN